MAVTTESLNQYTGTNDVNVQTVIVAPDMATACQVYNEQNSSDPVIMQCTKKGIACVLPTVLVSFETLVQAQGGETSAAALAGCKATPEHYVLPAGTKQIFSAYAAEGWEFVKWQFDGEDVEGEEGTKPVAMLTIPSQPTRLEITAIFKTV